MSTGNELSDLQSPTTTGDSAGDTHWKGIWDTNRPSLQAALGGLGYEVIDYGIVPDTFVLSRSYLEQRVLTMIAA
jgi:gephyrin